MTDEPIYEDPVRAHVARLALAERRPTAQSLPELKEHILELVRARSQSPLEPSAVTLAELNRRFGIHATRYGTTARHLVVDLSNEGKLGLKPFKQSVVAFDIDAIKSHLKPYVTAPDAYAQLQREIFNRAFKSFSPSTN